jgi:hypothetical protein
MWVSARRRDVFGTSRKERRMKARVVALLALAAAVTLTSVAAAGPAPAKQRVAINMKIYPQKMFVLTPQQAGSLKRDSGTIATEREAYGRSVMHNGQKVTIYDGQLWTLTGKQGTLTIRERNEWVDVSNENTRYGYPPGVAIGTWTVARGTGQYAQVTGGGRSGHAGLGSPWLARYEGFLNSP